MKKPRADLPQAPAPAFERQRVRPNEAAHQAAHRKKAKGIGRHMPHSRGFRE